MSKTAPAARAGTLASLLEHLRLPLYRNGYALILSAATTSGLGVIYWVLAARYYPLAVVGVNAALISAMMFVSGLAQFNLMSVMIRFLPGAGRASARLVGSAYAVSALSTTLIGTIFVLGAQLWSSELAFLSNNLLLAVWFILGTLSWGIFALQDNVLTGVNSTLWVPVENTIFAVVKIVLLLVFAQMMPEYGIFASWTIPVALSLLPVNAAIFLRLLPRHMRDQPEQKVSLALGQIVRFVASNYLGALCTLMATTLLPLIVTERLGRDANALFYQPWLIAASLQLVSTNMATSLTVEAAADQSRLRANVRRVLIHTARMLVPIVALLCLGASLLLHIFGAEYAEAGTPLLRLLALAAIPNIVNALYLSVARIQRHTVGIIAAQAAICVLALGLSYLLMPIYGITGVGWAWLITQTSVALLLLATRMRPLVFARPQPEGGH